MVYYPVATAVYKNLEVEAVKLRPFYYDSLPKMENQQVHDDILDRIDYFCFERHADKYVKEVKNLELFNTAEGAISCILDLVDFYIDHD